MDWKLQTDIYYLFIFAWFDFKTFTGVRILFAVIKRHFLSVYILHGSTLVGNIIKFNDDKKPITIAIVINHP